MKNFSRLFLFIFIFSIQVRGQDSLSIIKNFLNDEALKNSPVSIYVQNLDSGTVLLSSSPQLCITPASVLKLITTATAIEVLGKDYCFNTYIRANGPVKSRTLHGDLVVIAGGDPTLGSSYFNARQNQNSFLLKWVSSIKKAGIDTITGNVVVDPYIYSDQSIPQTWIWEDLGNYFGAAAHGLALYDNTVEITFKTGPDEGSPTTITGTLPYIPNLVIKNEVLASEDQRDRAYVFGSPFDSFRIIRGTLPKNRESFNIKASIPDPAYLLAYELKNELSSSGVTIEGNAVNEKVSFSMLNYSDSVLYIEKSPTLAKIIEQLNRESINLFAEHLCKHLGYITYGKGTTEYGVKAIKAFWDSKKIDTRNMHLADGSGLSRVNAITAKTLVDVLNYMYHNSTNFDEYMESIPLTGMQGTQQYYFQNSFLKGKAHAKSGSMSSVRSFAGYMTTKQGRNTAYAIIINNFDCGSSEMALKMEKLMEQIYNDF